MDIEWDGMPDAIPIFDDPYATTIAHSDCGPDEQRFGMLGVGAMGRLLVVVDTWRGENIRIIFARRAEAHDCEQ